MANEIKMFMESSRTVRTENVAVVAHVAVPFLSFLYISVVAGFFFLISQTFAPRLTTSRCPVPDILVITGDTERCHGKLLCVFKAPFLAS